MKTIYFAVPWLLAFSVLAAGCSVSATPANTPTVAPLATPTEETIITAETASAIHTPLSAVTINLGQDALLGAFLVDHRGFTLYLFAQDTLNTSTCTGECAEEWPPLLITNTLAATAGAGVDPLKLGTTMRADGSIQVTYKDWPLYYFDEDEQAGDVKGQGKHDFYVISPAGEKISK